MQEHVFYWYKSPQIAWANAARIEELPGSNGNYAPSSTALSPNLCRLLAWTINNSSMRKRTYYWY